MGSVAQWQHRPVPEPVQTSLFVLLCCRLLQCGKLEPLSQFDGPKR